MLCAGKSSYVKTCLRLGKTSLSKRRVFVLAKIHKLQKKRLPSLFCAWTEYRLTLIKRGLPSKLPKPGYFNVSPVPLSKRPEL